MSEKKKINYTKAQESAIDARGRTLLVSAAAGSGKTFTLTQRIIKEVIEDGRDLSRMLIVTFTRAAASDLKSKISKALTEAIAENPGNRHLQKQLIMLGSANISTIDSFFTAPIRNNFEKLGLPASMRLADEAELAPTKEKMMQETLDAFFDKNGAYADGKLSDAGYRSDYTDLLGIISAARDNSNLIPTLTDFYGKLITSTKGVGQLRKRAERLRDSASMRFFDTEEGKAVKEHVYDLVKYAFGTFTSLRDQMLDDELLLEKYVPAFNQNIGFCVEILAALEKNDYTATSEAMSKYQPDKIKSVSADQATEFSVRCKDTRAAINGEIKEAYGNYFTFTEDGLKECFSKSGILCDLLCDILEDYGRRYNAEKLRRGVCEFSDMPIYMLTLLKNKDGSLSEYAKSLANEFDEVYIDEYQDVNDIQDHIFSIIGGDHRFMVGDIKQSIYGFREADPSIFSRYRKEFSSYGDGDDTKPGATIFMSENFRCDENVIDFTNLVCAPVFTAFAESIRYKKEDDLVFAKKKEEHYANPKVKINLIETVKADKKAKESDEEDENGGDDLPETLSSEAIATANEIAKILRSGVGDNGEPIRPKDICVLLRSHSSAKPLLWALGRLNIKYSLSSKDELFDGRDMKILIDLLSVVDNPHSDIPLCRLLTAKTENMPPLFSTRETAVIRYAGNRKIDSLFDAVINYSKDGDDQELASRCKDFVAFIEKARSLASGMSADKFIRALSGIERYADLCETDAYTYLYDSACKYTARAWSGLYGFLKYFRSLIEKGETGSDPKKAAEDEIVIMSMHQSKGLEFNTCFLFGLGKRFNLADSKSPIILSKDFGVSMKLPPAPGDDKIENTRVRYSVNPLWRAADLKLKEAQVEEEARILYVALTRARERLYISATIGKEFTAYSNELKNAPDPMREIKKSKQFIRWILLSIFHNETEKELFDLEVFTRGKVRLTRPIKPRELLREKSPDSDEEQKKAAKKIAERKLIAAEERALADLLNDPHGESDDEKKLSAIPSKVAASKVSPTMLDESVFIPIPTGMLFSENYDDVGEADSENAKIIRKRIDQMRSKSPDFDSLLEVNKKPTAAEKGTAIHQFLQYCDFLRAERDGIDAEIERLRENRFISNRTASIIDKNGRLQLEGFFKSELFGHIKDASEIKKEFRFGMFKPAADFTEDENTKALVADKKIFVQGSIDLIIIKKNGDILLCDYKTDKVSAAEREDPALLAKNMNEKHGDQMAQYKYAVEQIFGRAPTAIYIYLVPIGKTVKI